MSASPLRSIVAIKDGVAILDCGHSRQYKRRIVSGKLSAPPMLPCEPCLFETQQVLGERGLKRGEGVP